MTTTTQTIQRPFVKPSRNYDYLYGNMALNDNRHSPETLTDPVFTLSSFRDHSKEMYRSQTGPDRLYKVPNYKNMFSTLRHYPHQTLRLDMTDPVPRHVPRYWFGYKDQARDTLIRYTKFNYDPLVKVPPKVHASVDVDGSDRYKFFRRPIIPFLPQMPPSVVLSAPAHLPDRTDNKPDGVTLEPPKTKTVQIQTDYRESEAQTDPYTPEYVVRPGSQPEVLTIATLSYGKGLPAGLAQVIMIERARAKRAWEATLPPLSDMSQIEKRRRMMEEQECLEWSYREEEIASIQEERMELMKKLLQQREATFEAVNDKRLEYLWNKKNKQKEYQIRQLRNDHIKALRKLTKDSQNIEKRGTKRNIIADYTNFDSQVYAPMTRIGVYLDVGWEQYSIKSHYNSTLDGLLDLEAALPPTATQYKAKPLSRPSGFKARKEAKLGRILDQVYNDLQAKKHQIDDDKPSRLLVKLEKPIPRPPTPEIEGPNEKLVEQDLAVILLQKLIRGCAVQKKMNGGKEMRLDLIRELRTTHALQLPEQKIKKKEAEEIARKQRAKEADEHKESIIIDGTEREAAQLIGQQLDFLNKELIRLQEERRIHAFVMLAERHRRMREADESGLRQREDRLRRTQDEVFKQILRVHQGTVDTYLENIILQSVEKTADIQAREEIRKQAEVINNVAMEFEKTRNELQSKEMVAEMVYYFLLPEIEKQTIREKVKHTQRKHLLAAHRIVHDQLKKEENKQKEENEQEH